MKIRHLYIKILLPFIALLIAFWLMSQTAFDNSFSTLWGESHTRESRLTALAISRSTGSLEEIVTRVGAATGSEIVITDKHGRIMATTPKSHHPKGHMSKADRGEKALSPLATIQLPSGKEGIIQIIGNTTAHDEMRWTALFWLLLGAGVLAIIAIPVTRQITRPLKDLHGSVRKIADGDLSHRATIQGHDEIADLAKTFNTMSDKIERVLTGGKELTANVSHELRSPLARMEILKELISNETGETMSPSLKESISDLDREIQTMDGLIDRILQFSKLDMGTLHAQHQTHDLSGIFAGSLERYAPLMKTAGLNLSVDAPDSLPFVGDYESLTWMIDNIIGNAIKFSPDHGDIQVNLAESNKTVNITVTNPCDSDVKVSEELFTPFKRGTAARPGSGLGLAIVKRAVRQHSGEIALASKDRWFTVQISLPKSG